MERLPGDPGLPPGVTDKTIDESAGPDFTATRCAYCNSVIEEDCEAVEVNRGYMVNNETDGCYVQLGQADPDWYHEDCFSEHRK